MSGGFVTRICFPVMRGKPTGANRRAGKQRNRKISPIADRRGRNRSNCEYFADNPTGVPGHNTEDHDAYSAPQLPLR